MEETKLTVLRENKEYTCTKKAQRIRTVDGQIAWPSIKTHTLLFSKLTKDGLSFYTQQGLNDREPNHDSKDHFSFYSDLKAEYG